MFADVTEIIGEAAARKLQAAFPGASIYVPSRDDATLAKRNRDIRAARKRAKPMSIADIMKKWELSRRQVWNILGGTD